MYEWLFYFTFSESKTLAVANIEKLQQSRRTQETAKCGDERGEWLELWSRWKKNCCRLIHFVAIFIDVSDSSRDKSNDLSVLCEQRVPPAISFSHFLSTAGSFTQSSVQHHTFANSQNRRDSFHSLFTLQINHAFVKLSNAIDHWLPVTTCYSNPLLTIRGLERGGGRGSAVLLYSKLQSCTKLYHCNQ